MDIEEELAELKAELDKMGEDPKLIRYVNSREYRVLLRKLKPQICEICGKEYKVTHLCETDWSFNWSGFQDHYKANNPTQTPSKEPVKIKPEIKKEIEITKQPYIPSSQPAGKKKSGSGCGTCFCILTVVVLIIIFL